MHSTFFSFLDFPCALFFKSLHDVYLGIFCGDCSLLYNSEGLMLTTLIELVCFHIHAEVTLLNIDSAFAAKKMTELQL